VAEPQTHRVLYDGHVAFVVDELAREDGSTQEYAFLVPPAGVAALALTVSGDAVLVRQHRHPLGRDLLEIPAGGVDDGEGPDEAMRRELEEECGLRAAALHRLGTMLPSPGVSSEHLELYAALGCEPIEGSAASPEEVEAVRLPLDELWRRVASGELEDAKTAVALLRADRRGLLSV
jgi:ADP-ribose pyrophosphatase